jgi:D-glycero-alpha-D-manno-heptose-7-phosphate kinase
MMFWTGHQRDTCRVLAEQKAKTAEKFDELLCMRDHAHQLRALVANGHLDSTEFGRIVDQSWQRKRRLASSISNPQIDAWYDRAMEAGAAGGKICGAGGGGFLLFIVPDEHRGRVREALGDLMEVPVSYEVHGSHVLLPFMD